jgi:hypothetical protein
MGLWAAACSSTAVHAPPPDGGHGDSSAAAGTGGSSMDVFVVDSTSMGGADAAFVVVDAKDVTDVSDAARGDVAEAPEARDATDTADTAVGDDVTTVLPTAGCGLAAGQALGTAVRGTIQTSGVKPAGCADSKCGAWSYEREYFLTLPAGYDKDRPYPLVLQGPGCGGTGADVYSLSTDVDDAVIRVGLTPPPNDIGHATNPGQGCFDDKEGDDSVDWVFYEGLYDKLATQLCFDRHRVFAGGQSSGAWFANELTCKYAGDVTRPVRGVLALGGDLPNQPPYAPTCSGKPFAGIFFVTPPVNDDALPADHVASNHAFQVDGCSMGTNIDAAPVENFPIGGGNPDALCKQIVGCPGQNPLVVCALPSSTRSFVDIVNPGFSTFLELFEKAPLLSP